MKVTLGPRLVMNNNRVLWLQTASLVSVLRSHAWVDSCHPVCAGPYRQRHEDLRLGSHGGPTCDAVLRLQPGASVPLVGVLAGHTSGTWMISTHMPHVSSTCAHVCTRLFPPTVVTEQMPARRAHQLKTTGAHCSRASGRRLWGGGGQAGGLSRAALVLGAGRGRGLAAVQGSLPAPGSPSELPHDRAEAREDQLDPTGVSGHSRVKEGALQSHSARSGCPSSITGWGGGVM